MLRWAIDANPSQRGGEDANLEILHAGARWDYVRLRLRDPSGRGIVRDYVRHPGSVVVVPLLEDPGVAPEAQRLVLIRNHRPSVRRWLLEFPAGTLDKPGEPEGDAALRELEEETGFRARQSRRVGTIFTSPGLTDERMGVWAAWGLEAVGQRLEAGEQIRVEAMGWPEVLAQVDSGELQDAKSLAALVLVERAIGRGEFKPTRP